MGFPASSFSQVSPVEARSAAIRARVSSAFLRSMADCFFHSLSIVASSSSHFSLSSWDTNGVVSTGFEVVVVGSATEDSFVGDDGVGEIEIGVNAEDNED